MPPSSTCHLRERTEHADGSPSSPGGTDILTPPIAPEEPIITTAQSLAYVEGFAHEDDDLAAARQRAGEVGVTPIGPAAGATLSFLAGALSARAVVEIGTGTGVSGLWLLRGMLPDGVLTSVDLEAEHQRHAREIFAAAGFRPQRFRLIAGGGLDVMPRMTDSGYDLVFLDAEPVEYGEYLDEAMRLVRPGGVIVFDNALWRDRVADPSHRDPETVAIRDVIDQVTRHDDLRGVLLPVGDGLLAVQRIVR
jgi:predicted O-methyltransferase YrrM